LLLATTAANSDIAFKIPGLEKLWEATLGSEQVLIAILDGKCDRAHPSLTEAKLTQLDSLVPKIASQGLATQHGTHIASIIFGQLDGGVQGIAPQCKGLSIPIFSDGKDNSIAPCSQIDLARAIFSAANQGAQIINISGGQLTPSGEADPPLANAVRYCAEQNVLIIAAVGNDGCDCLHIPGAIPSVLAVGAMNDEGIPLNFSNWGKQGSNPRGSSTGRSDCRGKRRRRYYSSNWYELRNCNCFRCCCSPAQSPDKTRSSP